MLRIKRQASFIGSSCSQEPFYDSGIAYHSKQPVFCHVITINKNANGSSPSPEPHYMPVTGTYRGLFGRWGREKGCLLCSRIVGSKRDQKKKKSYFFLSLGSAFTLPVVLFFSTHRKQQLNWTLPTLLRGVGLLSVVVPLKISKKAR